MSNDKDGTLSPEEIEIESIFNKASVEIADIDNQLNNLPPKRPPTLRFDPPGMRQPPSNEREHREASLKSRKWAITKEAKGDARKVITSSSPDVQAKATEKIDKWQNVDPKEVDSKTSREDIITPVQEKFLKQKNKDVISPVQDRLLKKKEINEQTDQAKSKNTVQPAGLSQTKEPNAQKMSYSMRFNQTLEYNNISDNKNSSPAKSKKSPEVEKDKD